LYGKYRRIPGISLSLIYRHKPGVTCSPMRCCPRKINLSDCQKANNLDFLLAAASAAEVAATTQQVRISSKYRLIDLVYKAILSAFDKETAETRMTNIHKIY